MSSHEAEWEGPRGRARRRFTWSGLLWSFIYPQRGNRIVPTVPGVILIGLAFGIGTAAYNSSSNILFITLSLLLACLILSGVLSWLNLRGVQWRLVLAPPLRVGQVTTVVLELRNQKRFLPTYGLWFEFSARVMDDAGAAAGSTISASAAEMKRIFAKAAADGQGERIALAQRLDPKGEGRVEWTFRPARRGRVRVELVAVGSLFPFGFLRKGLGTATRADALVWPAPVEYRRQAVATPRRRAGGERVSRLGSSGDLLALRGYAQGDSHRLIHWKASAKTGKLLVRQFAADSAQSHALWLRTDAAMWGEGERFERLIGFAGTMAEDLFRTGRLMRVSINGEPPLPVRRPRDLEIWLNRLAVALPAREALEPEERPPSMAGLITFAPDGASGVIAIMSGEVTAWA
ncbi:MAG: DUF58 domain-containing protein [Opitutaceae bacterium]|nr:DUF58 domain-containing protein [Opitutaceae bacterium]